jgi:ribonuclease HII
VSGDCAHDAIVDGESIAAASVVAKTVRDRLMRRLAQHHPEYAWADNKGYGTPQHLDALLVFGPSRHHRTSFEPVAQLALF